jgi:hypothetical protein
VISHGSMNRKALAQIRTARRKLAEARDRVLEACGSGVVQQKIDDAIRALDAEHDTVARKLAS